MGITEYRFAERWHLPVAPERVFDVLADLATYPEWWPQVRKVEGINDDRGRIECRSALPYTLRFEALRGREDRAAGVLEARLVGDLDGWSRWTVIPYGDGTELLYEQQVTTARALLRWSALLVRPLLIWNHAWMMRGGQRGLAARLAVGAS